MFEMVPNLSEYCMCYDVIFKKNYDGLPTAFIVTQYMIKSIGNQIVSANLLLLGVSS